MGKGRGTPIYLPGTEGTSDGRKYWDYCTYCSLRPWIREALLPPIAVFPDSREINDARDSDGDLSLHDYRREMNVSADL